ncbi:DUF4127 family protein [Micromonospora sp. SL1-18]|uniref:DUF4127 family protein n=1 Tax=Micromonospora sp. SL1-18 TaxID=3399128 RepID=UPI003A4E5255
MSNRAAPVVTLLPLDDRPVNTSHVAALATAAGTRLRVPPAHLLPPRGVPADPDRLTRWLEDSANDSDAVVVSVNQLVYGGYVASRRTTQPPAPALARLDPLRRIRAARPATRIHAFMTLMRTKQANGADTEPDYWDRHGLDFFALSRETYRAEHGRANNVAAARTRIPAPLVTDFFTRRMRLHATQLACLDLVTDGVVDVLSILVEDSTMDSVSTTEREWLETWIRRLDLGDRVRCLPGADEAGAVLTTRAALEHANLRPKVAVDCVDRQALERVAAYEDVPVGDTITAQLASIGADLVESVEEADLVLAVHPPGVRPGDWYRRPDGTERATGANTALAGRIGDHLRAGRPVAVADVADANGADSALVAALRDADLLQHLAGYAGWNTAGNSIGSVLAQGCARLLATGEARIAAHRRAVTHRLVEDWGYQTCARRAVITAGTAGRRGQVARELNERLSELGALADEFHVVPDSVHFPWGRAFEIDFELDHRRTGDRRP